MAVNREEFLKVFDETIGNREEDQELLESYEDDAKAFLPKLQNNNFPLYGLIGEYGTGKSTFLNAVKKYDEKDSKTKNIRITFEARKYPNRKELWDAFIIEVLSQVISQIINKDDEKSIFEEMDKIKKQMLGGEYKKDDTIKSNRNENKKLIGNRVSDGGEAIMSASTVQEAGSLEQIGLAGGGMLMKFLGSTLSGTITKSKESVSRIFDYEYFFAEHWINIIQQHEKSFNKVYIIIEDIDRCGDDGLIFLETLSYFMNTISKEKHMMNKMTCIVSIGNGFLNDNRHLINKAITSYEIFNMKTEIILKYFTRTFSKEELGFNHIHQNILKEFIQFYINPYGEYTRSIREIKYIFKKLIPHIIYKKEILLNKAIKVSDNVLLGMILFNFSLFLRGNFKYHENSNKTEYKYREIFNTKIGLYYSKPFIINGQTLALYLDFADVNTNNIMRWNEPFIFQVSFLEKYLFDLFNLGYSSEGPRNIYLSNKVDDISLGIDIKTFENSLSENLGIYELYISDYRLLNE